jgi:hypothetical protein
MMGLAASKADISHTHNASDIVSGILPKSVIPMPDPIDLVVVATGGFENITNAQEDQIKQGTYVLLPNGNKYVYKGEGSVFSASSYIFITTDSVNWENITGAPTNVTNLASLLSGKSDVSHTHSLSALGAAASVHNHNISDITGLSSALSEKTAVGHNHNISDVNDLSLALNSKAPQNHTHTASEITNFSSAAIAAVGDVTNASRLLSGTVPVDRFPSSVIFTTDPRLSDARAPLSHDHSAATYDKSGFLSAADKYKLDQLAQTNQVNADWNAQSGLAEILNKPNLSLYSPTTHSHPVATSQAAGFLSPEGFAKLSALPSTAGANIQSDWTETNSSSDAFIKNKPAFGTAASKNVGTTSSDVAAGSHTHDASAIVSGTIAIARLPVLPTTNYVFLSGSSISTITSAQQTEVVQGTLVVFTSGERYMYSGTGSKTAIASYVLIGDTTPEWSSIQNAPGVATQSANGFMSASDKFKLDGIASGAEINVQADWSVTDTNSDAFIKNKPSLGTAAYLHVPSTPAVSASDSQVVRGDDPRLTSATASKAGTMSPADKSKLDGLFNYSHPTGDGNSHVPATSTTNNGKFLKAGANANSFGWAQVQLSDIGISNATIGQVPIWNGTNWAPGSTSSSGVSGTGINNIVKLTAAQYSALTVKNATTLYVVAN